MGNVLSQENIEDLLVVCGTEPTIWNSKGEMQICCPVHGERNPSMGISSEKQICHCFSCGFAGDFPWLLFNSQPDQFPNYQSAREYIEREYDVQYVIGNKSHNILRYGESGFAFESNRKYKVLPKYKIAPYMSGKETYKYFFNRGFDRDDLERFMVGRDLVNKTVTLPVFSEDGDLIGVLGRYVSKNRKKNERYKIYDHFKRGSVLYPVDKYEPKDNTVILVEGQFDAIRMHKLGYTNTLATMGVALTKRQADWIVQHCDILIDIGDNDNRGEEAREKNKEMLKGRVQVLSVQYPDYGKDVCDWDDEDIEEMLRSAGSRKRSVRRYV